MTKRIHLCGICAHYRQDGHCNAKMVYVPNTTIVECYDHVRKQA